MSILDPPGAAAAAPADPRGGPPRPAPAQKPAPPRPRRRRTGRWRGPALGLLIVGLIGFDAWWLWRDLRPVPDLKAISDLMRAGRDAEAEPALREQIRRAPHDGDLKITLARLLAARQDLAGCARALHEVPRWWPKKPEALYREGHAHLLVDRARDAEAAWLDAVRADPLHPAPPDVFHDAAYELLKLYATEDRWEDALPIIWRAYDEADPLDREVILIWRLRSELERVAPLEALPRLLRYHAADPADLEATRALARAEQALGRSADADRRFREVVEARPDDPRGWRDYLAMLYEQGDWDRLLAVLARVPASADAEPSIWKFRGGAKLRAGDLAGAAADYRAAIERNPNVVDYHHRLALVEERLGLRDSAAGHHARAAELREARAQLPQAFYDFIDARARAKGRRGDAGVAASTRRLSTICSTLGFARAAAAWGRLADGA